MATIAREAVTTDAQTIGQDVPTLREMIDAIGRTVGATPRIETLPMQPGDVDRTYADLTRSTAELGYAPSTSFEDGLARQWAWLRERLSAE